MAGKPNYNLQGEVCVRAAPPRLKRLPRGAQKGLHRCQERYPEEEEEKVEEKRGDARVCNSYLVVRSV